MVKPAISVPVANRISVSQFAASYYTDCFMGLYIYRYVSVVGYAKMSLKLKRNKKKQRDLCETFYFDGGMCTWR